MGGVAPLLELISAWRSFLSASDADGLSKQLNLHAHTGRPLGADDFVPRVEVRSARRLRPRKPGPIGRSRVIFRDLAASACHDRATRHRHRHRGVRHRLSAAPQPRSTYCSEAPALLAGFAARRAGSNGPRHQISRDPTSAGRRMPRGILSQWRFSVADGDSPKRAL